MPNMAIEAEHSAHAYMLEKLRHRIISLGTPAKRALTLSLDILLIPTALWLAFWVRLGSDRMINPVDYAWLFGAAIVTAIPVFIRFGLYRAILRYMGRDAVTSIFNAVSLAALLLALIIYWARSDLLIPRMLVANYWVILGLLIGGTRFATRSFLVPDSKQRRFTLFKRHRDGWAGRRRIAIYGAGAAGFQLFSSLRHDPDIAAVAFIDDDKNLQGRNVSGVRIYNPAAMEKLISETKAQEVFLAIPSIGPGRRREILENLQHHPLHIRTVPSIYELTTGRKDLSQLQEVPVEDLLSRDVVMPMPDLLERCIRGQTVLVTGAGGSIGAELCRQIVELGPERLILFDHSEYSLFQIDEEIRADISRREFDIELIDILGSVADAELLRKVMSRFTVDTIYHAASYKHVPIVEHNIAVGLLNNVFGTLHAAQAALDTGVKNFVLVSTDKAVRPTNVMGASKRLAEMILQALAQGVGTAGESSESPSQDKRHTRFTMVRFGNVIGSSGSVIPKFRTQLQSGGPITVTHPDVVRYFMTITEAAQLVIQAGSMGNGGDVFVLDMGEPVRILDLALKMIKLSGLSVRDEKNPEGDIEIDFIGLRPGEKLYEELLIGNASWTTGHPKILRAEESTLDWETMSGILKKLKELLSAGRYEEVFALLTENVDGFRPHDFIVDRLNEETHQPPETDNVLRITEPTRRNRSHLPTS